MPEPFAPEPDIALAERLFEALRQATGGPEGITRASYGEGEAFAHALVWREAEALALRVETDAAMNLYLTLPGQEPGPALFIGSHLDSVPRGGNFDGAAGVLMGLSVVAGFRRRELRPPRDLTVMAIRAEESTWFNASYIGSRAAFGRLRADELECVTRADTGQTLRSAIAASGGDPEAIAGGPPRLSTETVALFLEPHIEQGPRLVEGGEPVGIVTGIRGSRRHRAARALGEYAHSGATPRSARRDAVSAVAALVCELNRLWREWEAEGCDLTVTIGQFATDAAEHAFSKVAGRVDFALDLRSQSPRTLDEALAMLDRIVDAVAREHRVDFDLGPLTGTEPARMDAGIVAALRAQGRALGLSTPLMACGAGHDAAVFAAMGVPTGMLFIRNANGSHNPREAMAIEDFAIGARLLAGLCLDPPLR